MTWWLLPKWVMLLGYVLVLIGAYFECKWVFVPGFGIGLGAALVFGYGLVTGREIWWKP